MIGKLRGADFIIPPPARGRVARRAAASRVGVLALLLARARNATACATPTPLPPLAQGSRPSPLQGEGKEKR
jgi:hypothetical protein